MSSVHAASTTPATVSTAIRNRFVADATDPIRFEWFMWALHVVGSTTWTKPMIAQFTRRGGTSLPFEN
jgi:hypothetical protein